MEIVDKATHPTRFESEKNAEYSRLITDSVLLLFYYPHHHYVHVQSDAIFVLVSPISTEETWTCIHA